jgi:hypothetical protein
MDLGTNLDKWPGSTHGRADSCASWQAAPWRAPEWAELRARLAAAHAARRAIAAGWPCNAAARRGSFSQSAAALLAVQGRQLDVVNRVPSDSGNCILGMVVAAAGASRSGGRG